MKRGPAIRAAERLSKGGLQNITDILHRRSAFDELEAQPRANVECCSGTLVHYTDALEQAQDHMSEKVEKRRQVPIDSVIDIVVTGVLENEVEVLRFRAEFGLLDRDEMHRFLKETVKSLRIFGIE